MMVRKEGETGSGKMKDEQVGSHLLIEFHDGGLISAAVAVWRRVEKVGNVGKGKGGGADSLEH